MRFFRDFIYSIIIVFSLSFVISCGSSSNTTKPEEHKKSEPAKVSGLRADSDGDGVPDFKDRCPNEKGPKENDGCPGVDSDGDGVFDDKDKCPNMAETVNGYLDEDGCPDVAPVKEEIKNEPVKVDTITTIKAAVVTPPVAAPTPLVLPDPTPKVTPSVSDNKLVLSLSFPNGTTTMKRPQVDALLEIVKAYNKAGSKGAVSIDVYNWESGNAANDAKLANKRADVIKKFLQQNKINADQIQIKTFGSKASSAGSSKQYYEVTFSK